MEASVEAMKFAGVAPHAGAWIETDIEGLTVLGPRVAPHAGAWIETLRRLYVNSYMEVAPHAGAWIETC